MVLRLNLELINVQQTKKEVKEVLSQRALEVVFKAAYLAKKNGKKKVTSEELEAALLQ